MSDLENKSVQELEKLQAEIVSAIQKAKKEERRNLFKQLKEQCDANGVNIGELVSEFSKPSRKGKRPAKFFNPENPHQTWSGMSRKPAWFKEALKRGVEEKDMLINAG